APQGQSNAIPAARWPAWRQAAALAMVALAIGAGAFAFITYRATPDLAAQKPPALPRADAWREPAAVGDPGASSIIPLAVLPFAALGDTGSATQLVADMMTDDLIN